MGKHPGSPIARRALFFIRWESFRYFFEPFLLLPVLGEYVESNLDSTVEQAIKRFKGSEKDFSDFKLLFPGEPTPKTDEEKKVAAARVQQAYADAVRAQMRVALRSEDKSLSDDQIQKRVENIMTRKFSELDQSDDDASLERGGC